MQVVIVKLFPNSEISRWRARKVGSILWDTPPIPWAKNLSPKENAERMACMVYPGFNFYTSFECPYNEYIVVCT